MLTGSNSDSLLLTTENQNFDDVGIVVKLKYVLFLPTNISKKIERTTSRILGRYGGAIPDSTLDDAQAIPIS